MCVFFVWGGWAIHLLLPDWCGTGFIKHLNPSLENVLVENPRGVLFGEIHLAVEAKGAPEGPK